jgi:hypothetical protein
MAACGGQFANAAANYLAELHALAPGALRIVDKMPGNLGWYIAEHDRLMAHWRAVLPNPILPIRLADWPADFDGT